MSARISLYATASDYRYISAIVDADKPYKYVIGGHHVDTSIAEYRSIMELPLLGISQFGESGGPRFVVGHERSILLPRKIVQKTGKVVCAIDLMMNPDFVVFAPGGMYNDEALIYGEVSAFAETEDSKAIMSAFRRAVRKVFRCVRTNWLGPEAYTLLASGFRLTQGINRPRFTDLAR